MLPYHGQASLIYSSLDEAFFLMKSCQFIGVRAGGEGGCSSPKFWATQIFGAAFENLGKAIF